jgi:hypothetical protein
LYSREVFAFTSATALILGVGMHLIIKRIQQIFKWVTLLFFGIVIYALTIGQIVPIEIADCHHMRLFYYIILPGFPIAILLTLVWTLVQKEGDIKFP